MDKLYLIEGESSTLIQKEIDKIIKKLSNVEIIKYDLSESSLDNVIETLDTYDMFLHQKVVIVNNVNFLLEKDENFKEEKFLKYINNPSDNILILVTNKINNRLKLVKTILDKFNYIKVSSMNLTTYVKSILGVYQMDNDTIRYFLNKVGSDYHFIYEELNKLMTFKLDSKIILKKDIDLITSKNIEASIFDLIDAIIKKNKKKTYELYNHFISNGTEIFQILVMLANQIRLIYNVKVLSHLTDYEISLKLEVKEYPVKLAREKGYSYKKEELLSLLYNLAIIDEDIKSGKQLIDVSFISFVMQM